MSIALDIALFLRENVVLKLNKKTGKEEPICVNVTIRGFILTLAFRLGSNPFSWISQEELANELSMSIDGLKKLSAKVIKTGLIEIIKNPKDKRKNLYRPAEFLINYHLERRKESSVDKSKKYVPKRAPIKKNRCLKGHLSQKDTCLKGHLSQKEKVLQPLPDAAHRESDMSVKKHINQSKIKSKVEEPSFLKNEKQKSIGSKTYPVQNSPIPIQDNFYPNYQNQKMADHIASKTNTTGEWLIKRFIEITKKSGRLFDNYDDLFSIFLEKQQIVPRRNNTSPSHATNFLSF